MSQDSDDKENKIKLGDGPSPLSLREGRAGKKPGAMSAKPVAPSRSSTRGGTRGGGAPRSGVSKIAQQAPRSHHLPTDHGGQQPAAHVMSDNYIVRHRWIKWSLIASLIIGFAAGMFFSPKFERIVKRNTKKAIAKVESYFVDEPRMSAKQRQKRRQKRAKAAVKARSKEVGRPSVAKTNERFFVNPKCSMIVNSRLGVTDYERMGRSEKILVAECFLLYGQATAAEATVRSFGPLLTRAGEDKINKDDSPGGLGDALFTLLDVHIAKTNYRAADAIMTRQCRVWQRSNTCVGKLTTLVARKFTNAANSAYRQMVLKGDKINKAAFARYYLAGAQIAAQKGMTSSAAKRFRQALNDAPPTSRWLRKRIYESYGVELYRRDEILELKRLMAQAQGEFSGVDPNAQVKLLLLAEIANPSKRESAVAKFLFDQAKAYQARGDLELIEILATEAIRFRHEAAFLKLLKRAKIFFASQYQASKQIMRELQVWEIRARLSMREFEFVFQSLGRYENEFGRDALSAHLRGIAYMGFSPNQQYQLLAAQEIQRSLTKQPNWEGLYALGTAFVRGGKFRDAAPVMTDLAKMVTVPIQRYWLEMLQAEYYIAGRNYPEAFKILQRWQAREPEFLTPVLLLAQAHQAMNQVELAQKAELELDAMRARVKTSQSREGRSSPIGPMALAPRSLN